MYCRDLVLAPFLPIIANLGKTEHDFSGELKNKHTKLSRSDEQFLEVENVSIQ